MAKAFAELAETDKAKRIDRNDWLALLLDREASLRRDKRLTARLRAAKLRQQASIEDGGRHYPGIPGRHYPVIDGRLRRNRQFRAKGMDEGDAVLRKAINYRIVQAMRMQEKRGRVIGTGKRKGASG
jgi:hypothetical protein